MKDRSARLHARQCQVCGGQFMAQRQDVRRGYAKYCSDACEKSGRAVAAASKDRIAARFWAKVDRNGPSRYGLEPCWLWRGSTLRSGYGSFVFCGERVLSHRVAFWLANDKWPEHQALHRCDVRCCVNPGHLFDGTHADNMADMASKGRAGRGAAADDTRRWGRSRRGRGKLTPDQVRAIRAAYVPEITSLSELGRAHGVSYRTIALVVGRKIWKDISG